MAELYKPLCMNMGVHQAHQHPIGWAVVNCLGYTLQQQQIADMIRAVWWATSSDELNLAWGQSWALLVHPAVPNMIMREMIPATADITTRAEPSAMLGMPLVPTTGLSWGQWMIVLQRGEISDDRVG